MKVSSLDYLVCLNCHGPLTLEPGQTMDVEHPEEILTGTLTCQSCSRQFNIIGGVPRMIDDKLIRPTHVETGRKFAEDWKAFPRMDARYREQFFDWVAPVDAEFLKDKLVLECGCGKGRHVKVVSESKVKALYAVDIGEAIDVAYKNVGHLRGVHLVQADIENMPFRKDFDFAYSVGVLHHMDSPVTGFLSMASKLNDAGSVLAWVYGRENNWWLIRIVNPIRVRITSKLPPALLMVISAMIALPLVVICKGIAAPWSRVQKQYPILPKLYYQEYFTYISKFDFNEFHHIVFDHLVAPVANYVAREYFTRWFVEAQLPQPIIRWHNRNSWTGFTSKQPAVLETMKKKVELALKPPS